MRVLALLCLAFLLVVSAYGQAPSPFSVEGDWSGAYVRGTSVQRVTAQVTVVDDTARIALTNEDWSWFGARDPVPMTATGDGRMQFDAHYGTAVLEVDSLYREMIGTVQDGAPPITLHLKKTPRPPTPPVDVTTQDIAFPSGDATLSGTVVRPSGPGPYVGLVYVAGRGCASRRGGVRRLRWLAAYGVVGLAYDNRGAGTSDGDCKTTTLDTESRDIRAAMQALAEQDGVDPARIGLFGNSAAGWYLPHAAARADTPPAFLITKVGPATSVEAQQKDNARLIADEMGLAPADRAKMLQYVDRMFADERPNEAVFAEMQDLLAHGDATGWADQFLVRNPDIGDVPATAAGLDSLWVRRYAYDPAEDWARYSGPMLAFFGADDRITPPSTNVPALRTARADAGPTQIVVVPETGHGLGQGSANRTLDTPRGRPDATYWKFYRVPALYTATLLRFLGDQGAAFVD